MTVLYRRDPAEPPRFGRRTLWTMHCDDADYLAQVEAATLSLPAAPLYQVEVTIGDSIGEQSVDDLLSLVQGKPVVEAQTILRNTLFRLAEHAGREWMQFTSHGRSWRGAMLYLGGEPLPAQRAPSEN